MQPEDARWMDLALRDAAKGLGRVAPNPAVGCVLVKEGRVIGRGLSPSASILPSDSPITVSRICGARSFKNFLTSGSSLERSR